METHKATLVTQSDILVELDCLICCASDKLRVLSSVAIASYSLRFFEAP